MATPVSTAQMIADRNVSQLQQQQQQFMAPQQVAPQQINYGHASNPIGLISSGLSTIGQTAQAPEQRRVAQANADRAELLRQEQQKYSRGQDTQRQANLDRNFNQTQANNDRNFAANQAQQTLTNARNKVTDDRATEIYETGKQKEMGALQKADALDTALYGSIDPLRTTQEANANLVKSILAEPDIIVGRDDEGKLTLTGTDEGSQLKAEKYFNDLKETNVLGNTEIFRRNLETKQLELANDGNPYSNFRNADIDLMVKDHVAKVKELLDLNDNEALLMSGELDNLATKKTEKYKRELGTATPAQQEHMKYMDLYTREKQEGGDTQDPLAGFMEKNADSFGNEKDRRQVDRQIKEALIDAKGTYNSAPTPKKGDRPGKVAAQDASLNDRGDWDETFANLAYQRALEKTGVQDGWWFVGDNSIDKDKFIKAVQGEMDAINLAKPLFEKKQEIDTDFANGEKAIRLKAQLRKGNVTKSKSN